MAPPPRRRRTAGKPVSNERRVAPSPRPRPSTTRDKSEGMSPGDVIEYSVSAEVQVDRGLKVWIKAGSSTMVREDEDGETAWDRLTEYVGACIDEAIEEHKK